ncbi:MAG: porin [Chryseolinea sp.]
MKSLLLRSLLLVALLITYQLSFAQDPAPAAEEPKKEEKTFTLSGSVDTYFHASLNTEEVAPGTSFSNLKGFSIGMVNLIGSYAGEKVGFTADLVFGPRGYDAVFGPAYSFSGNPSFGQRIINQAFAYYKFNDVVTLNLGQFNTFVGMETITPVPNTHYSTSYLFTNGPFNHTGLKADFTFKNGMVAKLAIMNPTDLVEFNPVSTYTAGAQVGYVNGNGGVWLNFLYGDPDGKDKDYADPTDNIFGNLFQADLTTGWTLSESFYLGANASYRTIAADDSGLDPVQFYGIALYPKLTLSENFALGLRAEHFIAKNGYPVVTPFTLDADGNGSVTEFTLSGNIMSGNLRIIPEVRLDAMAEDSYTKKDSDTAEATNTMLTFTLAAVYKF